MISVDEVGVRVSRDVYRALWAFVQTRPSKETKAGRYLYSVGIDAGAVCATDGESSVRFRGVTGQWALGGLHGMNGRVWPAWTLRKLAEGNDPEVLLPWFASKEHYFPPLHVYEQVAKQHREGGDEERPAKYRTCFQPKFFARLPLVAKACGKRAPLELQHSGDIERAEPMIWSVGGDGCEHSALVTIMPWCWGG